MPGRRGAGGGSYAALAVPDLDGRVRPAAIPASICRRSMMRLSKESALAHSAAIPWVAEGRTCMSGWAVTIPRIVDARASKLWSRRMR